MKPQFANYRADVLAIVDAAIAAAQPAGLIPTWINSQPNASLVQIGPHQFDSSQGRLFLVVVGKAALPMADAALQQIGDKITAGVILAKDSAEEQFERPVNYPASISIHFGGHPVSNQASVAGTQAIADLLANTTADDLVLTLISGGSSALLTQPLLPLDTWQALTNALLASGCDIEALNCIRTQLDAVKGGGLARMAEPAGCISLILSDVIGNSLAAIGSGPTFDNLATPDEARAVLQRYDIQSRLTPTEWNQVVAALEQADLQSKAPINPPPHNHIIGDVAIAAQAAAEAASQRGFATRILTTSLHGEARDVGEMALASSHEFQPPSCLLWAGETTVTINGNGKGGRNQELVLATVAQLEQLPNHVAASFATDGEDRLVGVAGAVATSATAQAARSLSLDAAAYLDDNDSFHFFQKLMTDKPESGGLLLMQPSGTNVNDILLLLKYVD